MNLGLLHPGEMGVTIGAALCESGHAVYWLREGRGSETARRARIAGFHVHDSLRSLLHEVQGVVSVCPPHGAVEVAQSVADGGFPGVFVDVNAVSPATARQLARIVGKNYVDGAIVGPPARSAGSTRLYLSGVEAHKVGEWFSAGFVETVVLGEGLAEASALKMCYAAYTKGSGALILAIRALAQHEGVTAGLLAEWARSQPGLSERSQHAAANTAPKAWRFVGEMGEIAATFRGAGLPEGFHAAAAEIYARMARLKDADSPGLEEVLRALH